MMPSISDFRTLMFFFSSRRRHTRCYRDWSSDVCSSDLEGFVPMSQLGIPDIQNPGDAVKEGQAVELKVLEVDPIHHRIVLAATGWPKEDSEIGRASCRERVESSVGGGAR